MRILLTILLPVAALTLCGCAAVSPSTPAGAAGTVERDKTLVRELTEVVPTGKRVQVGS